MSGIAPVRAEPMPRARNKCPDETRQGRDRGDLQHESEGKVKQKSKTLHTLEFWPKPPLTLTYHKWPQR